MLRAVLLAIVLAVVAGGLTACSDRRPDRPVIALLLPDMDAKRFDESDKPLFIEAVERLCENCVVLTYNADGDEFEQREQWKDALARGADVIVLDAVAEYMGTDLVRTAKVPVVAYDRFIAGADYYVSYDNPEVGRLQAEALVKALRGDGPILMVNGGVMDPNAGALKKAAHKVIDATKIEVVDELDPSDWGQENAKTWTAEQLEDRGADAIEAVYAASDAQAEGVVEAYRAAGVEAADMPILTGQDGELTALRRIVSGTQTMTVYKSIHDEAAKAAEIAVALTFDLKVTGAKEVNGVPSFVFKPVTVTVDNLTDTVVRDGLYTVDEICPDEIQKSCQRHGLL
ncbi:substrate-binding domain-containing protein [Nocardioides speluncae]|uniref:substrate-binding domain-containing protein n=1 Tax=Nocardioides speluncae TaxID=2670337 RepID=UPI00137AD117|nr:substrate-binding domain-containing protein [Nocardioides speluncae]